MIIENDFIRPIKIVLFGDDIIVIKNGKLGEIKIKIIKKDFHKIKKKLILIKTKQTKQNFCILFWFIFDTNLQCIPIDSSYSIQPIFINHIKISAEYRYKYLKIC